VFAREQDLEMSIKRLTERLKNDPPTRVPGMAIFLSANPIGAPAALLANIQYNGVVHERVLLLTVSTADMPHVPDTERVTFQRIDDNLYRGTVRFGFMEEPNLPAALNGVAIPEFGFDLQGVPYFVNRTRVIVSKLPGMALWREQLYTLLRQNAASPTDFFNLPPTQVFEIRTSVAV
jgi:KUP system potassium uptake protein